MGEKSAHPLIARGANRAGRSDVAGNSSGYGGWKPYHFGGQTAIDREEAARLYEALAQLGYEQREVIVLHLHGQLIFGQIAQQLDLSINTVQSRYRYGLEKLRALLNAGAER